MRKKLFTLLLATMASVSALFAESGTCGANLTWDLTNGVLTISGTGEMDNYNYNSPWFDSRSSITSLIIGNSVTSIGNYAFWGCTSLTSVTIPNSVTSIGDYAFAYCTSLTMPIYNDHVFAYMPTSYSGAYTIPDGIESIAGTAFYQCTGLTSVTIPNSVTSIGSYAFGGCTGLMALLLPDSVAELGPGAYGGDTSLVTLKFPANLTREKCSDQYGTDYSIRGSYDTDGGGWYHRKDNPLINIKNIDAPAWFFDVPETFWMYCPKQLENVVVNNGELSSNGFAVISRSYKSLKSLDLSCASNTELADEAIKNFYNITELKLPRNTERIGYMSVAECVKLQSIDIPASVIEIEDRAFENCRSLKTITFGGQAAGAPGRFNVSASSNSQLQRIGNWAFYNCHELQNLEIPEGVTEIGDGAFYGCTYLENLTLPASVQSIGDNTFALCAKMKKIVVNAATPPSIQAKTFFDVKRQIPVYVPDESISAYENDAYWQEFDIQGRSNMPTAVDQISHDPAQKATKLLRDGQILILRGDRTYTVTGQEIK